MLWTRKFQFFEKELVKETETGTVSDPDKKDKDDSEIKVNTSMSLFPDVEITNATSDMYRMTPFIGHGNLIYSDNVGVLRIIDHDFRITSFQAHDISVIKLYQLKKSYNILITVGTDNEFDNKISKISKNIKFWNFDKKDNDGYPTLSRLIKVFSVKTLVQYKDCEITAIVVNEELNILLLGLSNGALLMLTGDLLRDRRLNTEIINKEDISKLHDGPLAITSIYFFNELLPAFYVTTAKSILSYSFDKKLPGYTMKMLDVEGIGSERGSTCCLTDDFNLVIAQPEAAYFYEFEGKGPAVALDGVKRFLAWFNNYLIIVTEESDGQKQLLTIYDRNNKFIAYQSTFNSIESVLSEWNTIYLLVNENKNKDGVFNYSLYQLNEKDISSKMELLFRKKQYTIAINLANNASSNNTIDRSFVIDIFRMYGDHLYDKGDFDGAITQYIETIGTIEPSYVIRKFLDSQRINNLTKYLQILHERNFASVDHTTLLLNCYTKLKDVTHLDEFLKKSNNYDVDNAIRVCRQAGYYSQALLLAKRHSLHPLIIQIYIEDINDTSSTIKYISTLPYKEVIQFINKYGTRLIDESTEEMTQLMMRVCSSYSPHSDTTINDKEEELSSPTIQLPHANADDYLFLFIHHQSYLIRLIRYIIHYDVTLVSSHLYTLFIEIHLKYNKDETEIKPPLITGATTKHPNEEELSSLLRNPIAKYDEELILSLCKRYGYTDGCLFLYEKLFLYDAILDYYITINDYHNILIICEKYGNNNTHLWTSALNYFISQSNCHSEIKTVLDYIAKEKLLPPLMVVQLLASSSKVPFGIISEYIINIIEIENRMIKDDNEKIQSYLHETKRMREEIEELRTTATTFNKTHCDGCYGPLDLPVIHFLCHHSYHSRCLESASTSFEVECPSCRGEYHKAIETREDMRSRSNQLDKFMKNVSDEGFNAISEYFGLTSLFSNKGQEKIKSARSDDLLK